MLPNMLFPADIEEYRRFYHALTLSADTAAMDKFQEVSRRMAEFSDAESELKRLELQDALIELEQLVKPFPRLQQDFPRLLRLLCRGLSIKMTVMACQGLWNVIVETFGPRVFSNDGQRMAFPVSAF